MNTRIKVLRTHLKLSQTDFGEKLGVSRDVINNLENARVEPKELMIKTICSLLSVNEHWLRTGDGEMFVQTSETVLSKAADMLDLDYDEQKFLTAYLSLSETQRQGVKAFCRHLVEAYISNSETAATTEQSITVGVRPKRSDRRLTVAEKRVLMEKQLALEEKQEALRASTITNLSKGI